MAKILARSLNCVQGPTVTPCGECESCRSIAAGTSLDVIEMDAASNRSVDDIRELRERVGYAPAGGGWKVYILDEAHMLTREAWNAFLKTLEEPPPNTVFVLATTEPHKVMPTIVDRCQRFDFGRPTPENIAEVLNRVAAAEGISIDDAAVGAIARGRERQLPRRPRDARSARRLQRQPRSQTEDVLAILGLADADLLFAAADAIAAGDGRAVLELIADLARRGPRSLPLRRRPGRPSATAARDRDGRRGARPLLRHREPGGAPLRAGGGARARSPCSVRSTSSPPRSPRSGRATTRG